MARKGEASIRPEVKKTVSASPAESTDFDVYYEEISLSIEESTIETLTPQKKKTCARVEKSEAYNYSRPRNFLADLMTTRMHEELQDLLSAGIDFPEVGIVKIEVEHPLPGLD